MANPNVVYYEPEDKTGVIPGWSCKRVERPGSVSNSGFFRLARTLFKFTDGIPIG